MFNVFVCVPFILRYLVSFVCMCVPVHWKAKSYIFYFEAMCCIEWVCAKHSAMQSLKISAVRINSIRIQLQVVHLITFTSRTAYSWNVNTKKIFLVVRSTISNRLALSHDMDRKKKKCYFKRLNRRNSIFVA